MSKVRSDNISNRADDGAPALVYGAEVPVGYGITGAGGINITGIATAASFSGNLTGNATGLTGTPNITINNLVGVAATFTGVLTYEDVTNIDSIGIITARSGIEFGVSGAGGTITSSGAATFGGNTQVGGASYGNVNGLLIEPLGGIRATNNTASYHLFRGYTRGNPTNTSQITSDGSATFSTVTDSIGSLRRLGVNAQSGAYAFVVGDAGKIIRSAGSGAALTLNQNIFTAGDMISVFNVSGGANTVVQGTGVTLYNTADAATGTRTIAAKGMVTIVCTASNEFAISGSQLT